MREEDEVVVYLVVVGTVESVDRRVFDWLRRIHYLRNKIFGITFMFEWLPDIIDAVRVYEIDQGL